MAHRPKEVKVTDDNGLADGHPELVPENPEYDGKALTVDLDIL